MTGGTEQRPAQPQKHDFDLGRYDPYVAFVQPFLHTLEAAKPVDPIKTLTARLSVLPNEALAPATFATLRALTPQTYEETPPSPSVQAVYEYLDRITTTSPTELADGEHALRMRIVESQRNLNYFNGFDNLQHWTAQGGRFTNAVNSRWETLQRGEESSVENPDEERIAGLWKKVRTKLDEERAYEKTIKGQAKSVIQRKDPWGGFFGTEDPDPRIDTSEAAIAVATNAEYRHLLNSQQEQRSAQINSLTEEVSELRSIPATVSARALWKQVLTDDEKTVITQAREAYQAGRNLVAETEGFSSYREPKYRNFMDTHNNFRTSWRDQVDDALDSLRTVRKVLIDESGIPSQTQNVLQDKNHPIVRFRDETVYDIENAGLLTGYAADVATVFLMTDFDTPEPTLIAG